jgi:hypothetical protein
MAEQDRTVFPQVVAGPDLDRRAALYARVSTANGQDPQMQIRELCEYCKRRGWPIVMEYVDLGISGSKDRRPGLDRLNSGCAQAKIRATTTCGHGSNSAGSVTSSRVRHLPSAAPAAS